MPHLLENSEPIDAEPVNDELESLRHDVADLHKQLEVLRGECRQFIGLVKSARIVFGAAPAGAAPSATTSDSDKWERIKAKVGGKMAQIIEALQLTGTATQTQLRMQAGGGLSTIQQAIYKLRDMGLLVKNGDGWSLKP